MDMELTSQDARIERLERELLEVKGELHREIWRRKMIPLHALEYTTWATGLVFAAIALVLALR
jgi:hypothetical protein